jgi:hypothetical protein
LAIVPIKSSASKPLTSIIGIYFSNACIYGTAIFIASEWHHGALYILEDFVPQLTTAIIKRPLNDPVSL